jgi:hypothetical protein
MKGAVMRRIRGEQCFEGVNGEAFRNGIRCPPRSRGRLMFSNGNIENATQSFAGQFEPDGDRLLYRRNRIGAPIEVSPRERDRLVAEYGRRVKVMIVVLVGAMILMIFGGAFFFTFHDHPVPEPLVIVIGFGLIMILFVVASHWAWNAPVRFLADRPASGPARSKADAHREALRRLGWDRLAAAAGMGCLALMRVHGRENLWAGWNLAWMLLAAFMLGLAAVQAIRKLRAR